MLVSILDEENMDWYRIVSSPHHGTAPVPGTGKLLWTEIIIRIVFSDGPGWWTRFEKSVGFYLI